MGMMAAKHTDLVVGMDMHMIQPPAPAPPVMVPHPVAGMIMDPADYSPGACTVFINGLPRARAGTMCMMSPPHMALDGGQIGGRRTLYCGMARNGPLVSDGAIYTHARGRDIAGVPCGGLRVDQ